jgi:CMP/dCMP kinase
MPPQFDFDKEIIAIDGPAGAGKTTAGVWLAYRLGLPFIESGYFFRGLAVLDADVGALPEVDVDARVPPSDDWRPTLRIDGESVNQVRSDTIESGLAALVGRRDVRSAIAQRVLAIASDGGGVVVGRRTAIESLAAAPVRVLMTASSAERLRRRSSADKPKTQDDHQKQLRAREPEPVDDAAYTLRLDTTEMSVADVRNALLDHVQERIAR